MYNKCDKCASDKSWCSQCVDHPDVQKILASLPRQSRFMYYKPTCPRGYVDCVYDPAYIHFHYPDWYKELYGDKTPEEAAEKCRQKVLEDPSEEYYCYDDEDK